MLFVFLIVGTIVAVLIGWLNLWDHERRATMTSAERAADDAETRREANIW